MPAGRHCLWEQLQYRFIEMDFVRDGKIAVRERRSEVNTKTLLAPSAEVLFLERCKNLRYDKFNEWKF